MAFLSDHRKPGLVRNGTEGIFVEGGERLDTGGFLKPFGRVSL